MHGACLFPLDSAGLEVQTQLGGYNRSLDLPEPGSSGVDQAFKVTVQLLIHSVHSLSACRVLGITLRAGDTEAKTVAQKHELSLAPRAGNPAGES